MSKFEKAFNANTDGMMHLSVGTCDKCDECKNEIDEGHFSWTSCDTCGSSLGGDRFAAHYIDPTDCERQLNHIEVCVDCLQYIANGELPEIWEG